MSLFHDAPVGATQLLIFIDSVGIGAAQAVEASALVKAAAHSDALIGQGKDGFADAGILRVKTLLYDLPRVDREMDISIFFHG